jgi:hypothetical protein
VVRDATSAWKYFDGIFGSSFPAFWLLSPGMWELMGCMTTVTQRTEARAHQDSIRFTPEEIADGLREILGSRLVAYLGHVTSTRQVEGWATGSVALSDDKLDRLRVAYHVAALLRDHEGPATVQAWFKGMNPQLDDQAPAQLLREQPLGSAGPAVLAAARAFAFIG